MQQPSAIPSLTRAPEDLLQSAQEADAIHCQLAREDANAFMEYVLKHEETGKGIEQSAVHEDWHREIDQTDRLLIWSHVESGKTSQISIGRTLFELGKHPGLRAAVVSNTYEQAVKIVRTIAKYIEESDALHRVFPKLQPGQLWTANQITVARPFVSKDPSVQGVGVHGNILGARIDLLLLDDLLDFENTRSAAQRQELWDWYHATLVGRLTANARVVCVGTAFHPDDFLHRLGKQPRWKAKRYPVIDPETLQVRWPKQWPPDRVEKKREELGPLEFARQMMCIARDDSSARFKQEWIDQCLRRGNGKQLATALKFLPPGFKTYTGVDLAVQKHSAADQTVLFTIGVHPNGDREVLELLAGRWSGPEIVGRMIDAHRRFFSILWVENNAAQDFILQFARGSSAIPIRPITTGRNKAHPEFGVESIATEMANAKWIIPNQGGKVHPEVGEWITEMLYYNPDTHTGDRLMACWFSREGARQGAFKVEAGRLDLLSR